MISYNSINPNQPDRRTECITIGRMAPDFVAQSTFGYIRLSDYRGKWVLLSSQPMAFTSVATTEIIRVAQFYEELQRRNVEIIGLTTDNVYANLAWVYDIYQKTGVSIPFPIIADSNMHISEQYGMLSPDRIYEETVRDAFLINPFGRIRAIITLPVTTGRDILELIRIIDSIQIAEQYNLYTPADWEPGGPLVAPLPRTYDELITRVNTAESQGMQCPFWYLCYTTLPTETNTTNDFTLQPPTYN